MVLPYLDAALPIPIAHRGGHAYAPENTVAAFDHALGLGFRHLETDVHLSADGVVVAFHDSDLERLAGLSGTIADQTWETLAAIDLGGGHSIPTMEELFVTFPEARFNIDPKVDAAVEPLGDLVERFGAVDRIGIGSFDDRRIARLQERFGPALCTSPGPVELLTNLGLPEWSDDAFGSHACLQVPNRFAQHQITGELVERAHDLDLQVHVWTINDREEMHQLLDIGVDAIISDELDLLLAVLTERADGHRSPDTKGST